MKDHTQQTTAKLKLVYRGIKHDGQSSNSAISTQNTLTYRGIKHDNIDNTLIAFNLTQIRNPLMIYRGTKHGAHAEILSNNVDNRSANSIYDHAIAGAI